MGAQAGTDKFRISFRGLESAISPIVAGELSPPTVPGTAIPFLVETVYTGSSGFVLRGFSICRSPRLMSLTSKGLLSPLIGTGRMFRRKFGRVKDISEMSRGSCNTARGL